MQNTGIIILKNAGQAIPSDFIQKALAKYPSCSGFAASLREEDQDFNTLFSETYNTPPTADQIEAFQTECLDSMAALSLNKFDGSYFDDDIQPFILVKAGDGQDVMAGFLVGDFSKSARKGGDHVNEFYAAMASLSPRLQKIFNDSDQEVELLNKAIREPEFKTYIEGLFNPPSTILLMDCDGEVITFGDNPNVKMFDWGWATDDCEPVIVEEPAPVVAPKTGRFGRMKAAMLAATTVAEPAAVVTEPAPSAEAPVKKGRFAGTAATAVTAPPKDVKAEVASTLQQKDKTATTATGQTFVYASPPVHLSHNKTKEWYQKCLGSYPENWKEKPVAKIAKDVWDKLSNKVRTVSIVHDPASLKDLKALGTVLEASASGKAEPTPAASELPKKGSDVKASDAERFKTPVVTGEALMVVSPESKAKINVLFKEGKLLKTLDQNHQVIPDPLKMNEMEKRFPTFAQAVGLNGFDETDRWTVEQLKTLCRNIPDAAAVLLANYRADSYKNRLLITQLAKEGKAPTLQDDVVEPVKTTETPIIKAPEEVPAAPAKKRRFG